MELLLQAERKNMISLKSKMVLVKLFCFLCTQFDFRCTLFKQGEAREHI